MPVKKISNCDKLPNQLQSDEYIDKVKTDSQFEFNFGSFQESDTFDPTLNDNINVKNDWAHWDNFDDDLITGESKNEENILEEVSEENGGR